MEHVFLVIHLMLALAIVGLVLLQRSEGGGLGIGGGGMGGLATPKAAANALTKATAFCAACFFGTSLILGIMANSGGGSGTILDRVGETVAPVADDLGEGADDALQAVQDNMDDRQENEESEATETPTVPISE